MNYNVLEVSDSPGNNYCSIHCGNNAGVYSNASNQFAQVNYNDIDMINGTGQYEVGVRGIVVHDSEVLGNIVSASVEQSWSYTNAIVSLTVQRFRIMRFILTTHQAVVVGVTHGGITGHGWSVGILSFGDGAPRHTISNNEMRPIVTQMPSGHRTLMCMKTRCCKQMATTPMR